MFSSTASWKECGHVWGCYLINVESFEAADVFNEVVEEMEVGGE